MSDYEVRLLAERLEALSKKVDGLAVQASRNSTDIGGVQDRLGRLELRLFGGLSGVYALVTLVAELLR